jgi:hypothetical protein
MQYRNVVCWKYFLARFSVINRVISMFLARGHSCMLAIAVVGIREDNGIL